MRRERGFSLVEGMVVVGIITLLMAIGMPSFMTWLRNVQIRNQAEVLQNGLQLARTEALRRNERVSFWMLSLANAGVMDNSCARSASGASWVVSRSDPAGACSNEPSDNVAPQIMQKRAAGDGSRSVTVAAAATGGAATSCITFNGYGYPEAQCSDGALSNPLATIDVTSSDSDSNTRALKIVISGAVIRMCDPAVTLDSDPRKC